MNEEGVLEQGENNIWRKEEQNLILVQAKAATGFY